MTQFCHSALVDTKSRQYDIEVGRSLHNYSQNRIYAILRVKQRHKIYNNNESKLQIQLKVLDTIVKTKLAAFEILANGFLILSVKTIIEGLEKREV